MPNRIGRLSIQRLAPVFGQVMEPTLQSVVLGPPQQIQAGRHARFACPNNPKLRRFSAKSFVPRKTQARRFYHWRMRKRAAHGRSAVGVGRKILVGQRRVAGFVPARGHTVNSARRMASARTASMSRTSSNAGRSVAMPETASRRKVSGCLPQTPKATCPQAYQILKFVYQRCAALGEHLAVFRARQNIHDAGRGLSFPFRQTQLLLGRGAAESLIEANLSG